MGTTLDRLPIARLRITKVRAISLFALLSLVHCPAAGANAECYAYRNHLPLLGSADTPGQARDVAVAGDYAYVADGEAGLAILRVAESDTPILVATLDTPGIARGVVVSGHLAVLAEGATGIVVADVSDPEAPFLLGGIDTPGDAFAVAFGSTIHQVYVADYAAGLTVVDLGDPTSPAITGTVDTPGSAVDVAMTGDDYACVADLGMGIQIIAVNDPHAPAIVAQIPTSSESVVGVDVQGTFLYGAEGEQPSGVAIFDLSNPLAPAFAGYCNTPGVGGVSVSGSHAYLHAGPLTYVIDVTDPIQSRVAGAVYGPPASGLAAIGDRLYVAAGAAGLRIIDTHSPESPLLGFRRLGSYSSVGSVTAAGHHAFVWSMSPLGDSALYVIDMADPALPVLGVLFLSAGINDTFTADGRLYATAFRQLHVIDVTDPNPLLLGSAVLPANGRGLAVAGATVLVAAEAAGLIAVDVSDPAAPSVIGSLALPGQARDVAIAGSVAVVASLTSGLFTVDITDPSAMALLGHLGTPGEASGVLIDGALAYVAAGSAGVVVVDLTQPDGPLLIGGVDTPGGARDLALSGPFAYVADSGAGLQVIDIRDPSAPRFVGGTYPGFGQTINHGTYVPGSGVQAATAAQVACLAGGLGGFRVYPLQCDLVTPVSVTALTASSNASGIELSCRVHADLARLTLQRAIALPGELPDQSAFAALPGTPDPPRPGGVWKYLDTDVRQGMTYSYQLVATLLSGERVIVGSVAATASPRMAARTRLKLAPNPARGEVMMELVSAGRPGHPVVRIYDATGRCVRRLEFGPSGASTQNLRWDGRDVEGRLLGRGTYYLHVEEGGQDVTASLTWLP